MSEKLGKIERLSAESFKGGRKLYFVPLVYSGPGSSEEFVEKCGRYWGQVDIQVSDLELKLGRVGRIYHELIPVSGEDGAKVIKDLNDKSYEIIRARLEKGAQLEAAEDSELLTEFMDWGRCLAVGLQNQKVFSQVIEYYAGASQKRNEFIARHIDETLKANEVGILIMREGHQVQFPSDVEVFYVAPPALDEINRWLRDREAKSQGG